MTDTTTYASEFKCLMGEKAIELISDSFCLTENEIRDGIEFTLSASAEFAIKSQLSIRTPQITFKDAWDILYKIFPSIPNLSDTNVNGITFRFIPHEIATLTSSVFLKRRTKV